jgi:diphosphomevalonate decarboxylase
LKDGVSRVILTSVGEGPIKTEESLITANGMTLNK